MSDLCFLSAGLRTSTFHSDPTMCHLVTRSVSGQRFSRGTGHFCHAPTKLPAGTRSNKPEVVGQLMVSAVITLPESAHVSEAVSIFTIQGISHIPIMNEERRLSGMLSRTDVARSLQTPTAITTTDAPKTTCKRVNG